MANYYTYGEIPDVEQAFSGGLDFVSRADLLDQMPAFSAPATTAPSSGGGSSAPTWYRWSDGTYNRNPESTGIRTPYDQLPDQYKQIDSRRPAAAKEAPPPSPAQPPELVTEPDKGFMRTGPGAPVGGLTPLPEEPPVGPPPLSLLDDEGLTPAPEPEPSVEMFNWPDGTRRAYPPPPEISGLAPAPQGPSGLGSRPSQELPVTAPAIAAPSQELNRPQALPSARVAPEPPVNLFVEGADVPEGTGLNLGALDELFANLRKTEELQKLALEPGLLQQGFTGTSGVTAPPSGAGIFATPTAPTQAPIDFEVTPEMAGALQAVARPADITAAERQAVTSNPRVQALQRISDQLKANDFAGAFNTALAAEQELGGDFVGNIIDSNKMRSLRGPMTAEEITKFYNEMPENVFTERYLGPGNEFKKEQAIERNIAALGGQAGYVDPMLGVKKEETLLSKLPVKELAALAAAAMGATAIPGLLGGASSGAGAAGAGGAGAAGAAGGAGALTGVVPTGLIPGAVSAAGLGTATFPILASSGLTASQIAALGLGAAGAAGAATGGAGAPATAATTPAPQPPLEEVVVTGSRAIDPSLLRLIPGSLASANLIQGMTDIPTDIYGQVEGQPDLTEGKIEATEAQQPQEPFKDRLAEVIVTGSKYKPGLLDLAAIGTGGLTAAEILKGFTEPTVRPYEKVTPEGEAPTEEVVVTGTRPPPIDLAKIGLGGLTAAQLMQGFTQPKVDPLTGEPKQPPKTQQELDAIQAALKAGTQIPGTGGVLDRLKGLLDKYGTLENALKVLGTLGSAGAGGGAGVSGGGTGVGGGGMGGALPKYTYTRKPLSPAIDYYTYGTRPEAQFFEQGLQLESPTQPVAPQPQLPPARPPGDEPVMAQGGLMGYAKGGSKKSRYFDGLGSGRDDKIPALLSDGEYVMDAETLALLGDGSTKEGARRMDKFRAKIRQHKGRALSRGQISPDAKSPEKYMGGGLS